MHFSTVVAVCAFVAGATASYSCSTELKWHQWLKSNGNMIKGAINSGGSPFKLSQGQPWEYTIGNAKLCIVNKDNSAVQWVDKSAVAGGMEYILNNCCDSTNCQAAWAQVRSSQKGTNYVNIISADNSCSEYSNV